MSKTRETSVFETYSTSLCPECLERIPMKIFEEDGVIYLEKTCPKDGKFEDVYWGDAELFKWFYDKWYNARFTGSGLENPHTKTIEGCPYDCGICPQHKTATILGIIDVTNRCNMACPVCFAYAGASKYPFFASQTPGHQGAIRHNPVNSLGISSLTKLRREARRLMITLRAVVTNSASRSKSSKRKCARPPAASTNGSGSARLVQGVGIEHRRPSALW